jgi:hypothetical protein
MNPPLLERITLQFPGTHPEFHDHLLSVLEALGKTTNHRLDLSASQADYLPRLSIDFHSAGPDTTAEFESSEGTASVRIENITGAEKRNPLPYRPLAVDAVSMRIGMAGWKIIRADHIGFNLPWFDPGAHPRIEELRKQLAGACLYHTYPSGEPWDFILPGDPAEISRRKSVDYTKTRRPKFELVSFDRASTPLVQIDICVDARFEDFTRLFPEALADPAFRNIWIYLENPYSIDVCLVINEDCTGDWCGMFQECRI